MSNHPIKPLPSEVVSLISAGEVIDSLASAVRELAENSIDGSATRIGIEISSQSLTVQVTDNGVGMDWQDLQLATMPHATSKIATLSDLTKINTLGFRGEALHCLAQLGELTISSRAGQQAWTVRYDRQGNWQDIPQPIALAQGTIVQVKQLFSAYPHRLQRLPSIPQQIRQAQKQIHYLAVTHAPISWQVKLDGKPWFQIWGTDHPAHILTQILQGLTIDQLLIKNCADLQLVMSAPDRYHRPRMDWVKVAINGRIINSPELESTILSCFQRTLPRQRFPLCFAHLHIDPSLIDWNRHPAKAEIYLENLPHWQNYLKETICQLLQSPVSIDQSTKLLKVQESEIKYNPKPSLKVIAQVLNTYILVEGNESIYLIEQHTAHERILYENLEDQWQIVPLETPMLLTDLTELQVSQLQHLGIDIQEFGNQTWTIRSIPKLLVNHPEQKSILWELSQQKNLAQAMAQLACRTAYKNGTSLDRETMEQIISQWQALRHPQTCPHGRPIVMVLDSNDLSRIFKRNWLIS